MISEFKDRLIKFTPKELERKKYVKTTDQNDNYLWEDFRQSKTRN